MANDDGVVTYEDFAKMLRETYWREVGEARGPWEEASEASKSAWISTAYQAHRFVLGRFHLAQ